jgi:hypothetical protein
LASGELRDLAGIVGALLNQGKCLQHGVVQVSGQLRALLGANSRGALGRQVAAQPPEERRQDQGEGEDGGDRGQDHVPRLPEGVVRRQEQEHGADHERDPETPAVEVGEPTARGPLCRRPPLGWTGLHGPRLTPEQRAAGGRQHQRPDEGVRPPDSELAKDQQEREAEQADAGGDLPVRRVRPARRRLGRGGLRLTLRLGDERPGDHVRKRCEAGRRDRDHHQRDPDQDRVDAEVPGHAGADAGDHPVVRIAAKRRARRFGRDLRCGRVHLVNDASGLVEQPADQEHEAEDAHEQGRDDAAAERHVGALVEEHRDANHHDQQPCDE